MTTLATLSMYDWPDVREQTDKLWSALRDAMRSEGISAPDRLDRDIAINDAWTHPGLVLSQTCGMPYRQSLHGNVTLIGTPDYGIEGCPPGYYCSVLIARDDDPRETLADFKGCVLAYNARHSESGYAAILRTTKPLEDETSFFSSLHETGGHAASIRAIAEGHGDIASIDAVTWRFASEFDTTAGKVRVLQSTAPTPGLPYISAKNLDGETLAKAVSAGISNLDAETREILGLRGFVNIAASDYLAFLGEF